MDRKLFDFAAVRATGKRLVTATRRSTRTPNVKYYRRRLSAPSKHLFRPCERNEAVTLYL